MKVFYANIEHCTSDLKQPYVEVFLPILFLQVTPIQIFKDVMEKTGTL
jgi:hypothetical protein